VPLARQAQAARSPGLGGVVSRYDRHVDAFRAVAIGAYGMDGFLLCCGGQRATARGEGVHRFHRCMRNENDEGQKRSLGDATHVDSTGLMRFTKKQVTILGGGFSVTGPALEEA
jgi:hypothetical protein